MQQLAAAHRHHPARTSSSRKPVTLKTEPGGGKILKESKSLTLLDAERSLSCLSNMSDLAPEKIPRYSVKIQKIRQINSHKPPCSPHPVSSKLPRKTLFLLLSGAHNGNSQMLREGEGTQQRTAGLCNPQRKSFGTTF